MAFVGSSQEIGFNGKQTLYHDILGVNIIVLIKAAPYNGFLYTAFPRKEEQLKIKCVAIEV